MNTFNVLAITFNLNQHTISSSVHIPSLSICDVVIIATQEATGAQHRQFVELVTYQADLVPIYHTQMLLVGLSLLCRPSLSNSITCISSKRIPDGLGNFPNKGGVAVHFCLFQVPFSAYSIHLLHGEDPSRFPSRCRSLYKIATSPSPCCSHSGTRPDTDRTSLYLGDFNFRVHGAVRSLTNTLMTRNDIDVLLHNDQFSKLSRKPPSCKTERELLFISLLKEGSIDFPPYL
ncbi:hypothetical protein GEMRC1_002798 [Eukaryota sp. GEM-RC1]